MKFDLVTISAVGFPRSERTELLEFQRIGLRTCLARCAPTHGLSEDYRATAATRFGDQ